MLLIEKNKALRENQVVTNNLVVKTKNLEEEVDKMSMIIDEINNNSLNTENTNKFEDKERNMFINRDNRFDYKSNYDKLAKKNKLFHNQSKINNKKYS